MTPQPILDTEQHAANPPLSLAPKSPRTGQLILKGERLLEVHTPSGHPPACVVRAGDWS
jgi:hypothetical protein